MNQTNSPKNMQRLWSSGRRVGGAFPRYNRPLMSRSRSHRFDARLGLSLMRAASVIAGAGALLIVIWFTFQDGVVRPQLLAHGQDKWEHFIAFTGLSFLFALGGSVRDFRLVGALLVGLAFATEALQPLVTLTREASLKDAVAGVSGVGLGLSFAACANVLARPLALARA